MRALKYFLLHTFPDLAIRITDGWSATFSLNKAHKGHWVTHLDMLKDGSICLAFQVFSLSHLASSDEHRQWFSAERAAGQAEGEKKTPQDLKADRSSPYTFKAPQVLGVMEAPLHYQLTKQTETTNGHAGSQPTTWIRSLTAIGSHGYSSLEHLKEPTHGVRKDAKCVQAFFLVWFPLKTENKSIDTMKRGEDLSWARAKVFSTRLHQLARESLVERFRCNVAESGVWDSTFIHGSKTKQLYTFKQSVSMCFGLTEERWSKVLLFAGGLELMRHDTDHEAWSLQPNLHDEDHAASCWHL